MNNLKTVKGEFMAHILAINPGSTSTKIAIYEDKNLIFKKHIKHDSKTIGTFMRIVDQFDYRLEAIIDALQEAHIDMNHLSAVVGRGGILKPMESGTYLINDRMMDEVKMKKRGEHASNLGCLLAYHIANPLSIPSYIVDPVAVDELEEVARYTGMKCIYRESLFHALNHKAVGLKAAEDLNKDYKDLNLIICHLGGGISVGAHKKGRVIDVNNALDGDGPMSVERSGGLPLGPFYQKLYDEKLTIDEVKKLNYGQGGLVAYLNTNDGQEILRRISVGDKEAKLMYEVMCYQVAKEIGKMAVVLDGDVDGIVLTGGLAYHDLAVKLITDKVKFISDILVYPGEDELEALAFGALRVLKGIEDAKIYK